MDTVSKTCIDCKESKSLSEFPKDKSRKSGYKERCKCCRSARRKKAYADNPEHYREYRLKQYRKDPKKNSDAVTRWRHENPLKARSIHQRRRAKIRGAVGTHTAEQLKARFDYYGNKCRYCGCGGKMTVEHVIPLSKGGTNWPSNLVPACLSCNTSKKDKNFKNFI